MDQEKLRMQLLAGIITESEYTNKIKEINLKQLAAGAALGLSTLLPGKAFSQDNPNKIEISSERDYMDDIMNISPQILDTTILDGQGNPITQFKNRTITSNDFKTQSIPSDFMLMRRAKYGDTIHEFIIFPIQKGSSTDIKRVDYEIYIDGTLVKNNQTRKKIESTVFSDMYGKIKFLK
jgi:hypothetical protein